VGADDGVAVRAAALTPLPASSATPNAAMMTERVVGRKLWLLFVEPIDMTKVGQPAPSTRADPRQPINDPTTAITNHDRLKTPPGCSMDFRIHGGDYLLRLRNPAQVWMGHRNSPPWPRIPTRRGIALPTSHTA